jgi:hypothetical protein
MAFRQPSEEIPVMLCLPYSKLFFDFYRSNCGYTCSSYLLEILSPMSELQFLNHGICTLLPEGRSNQRMICVKSMIRYFALQS